MSEPAPQLDIMKQPGSIMSHEANTQTLGDENAPGQLDPFMERINETLKTLFLEELPEKGNRAKRVGALVLGATTQVLDRGRAMVFLLPTVFDEVLEHGFKNGWNGYQTGSASAFAVGGAFGLWGWLVGRSFHGSLNAFPATTKKVTENHPVMVEVISGAIDGFPKLDQLQDLQPSKPEHGYDVSPYQTRQSKLGKIALGGSRGFKTAFLFGTTAHVGVSKVSDHSEESNKRRRRAVTAESALVLGGVTAAVSSMVTHDFLGLAENVKNVITNKAVLGGASLGFIGISTLSNYTARRNQIRENTSDEIHTSLEDVQEANI